MKAIHVLKLAAGTLLIAAAFQASAQDAAAPDTAAPATAAAAASPTPAAREQMRESRSRYRAVRSANRRLARNVRSALARDSAVSVANITVRAKDGAVTLQGTVPAQAQIDRAGDVAKGVEGVTSVNNALTIRRVSGSSS